MRFRQARRRRGCLGDTELAEALESSCYAIWGSARRAITAGLDLAMYAQAEQASADAYSALMADVHAGDISTQRIHEAAQTIQILKHRLGRA